MGTKNKYVVIDSSSLIALANKSDSTHKKAVQTLKSIETEKLIGILPNDVYVETLNTIGKKLGKFVAIHTGEKLSKFQWLNIEESSREIRNIALRKLKLTTPSVSFTDCIVMATADEYQTKLIFGFDEHFKKNSYSRVGVDNL